MELAVASWVSKDGQENRHLGREQQSAVAGKTHNKNKSSLITVITTSSASFFVSGCEVTKQAVRETARTGEVIASLVGDVTELVGGKAHW